MGSSFESFQYSLNPRRIEQLAVSCPDAFAVQHLGDGVTAHREMERLDPGHDSTLGVIFP